MAEARLAAVFKGVNRRMATHLLSEGESPECLDCGPGDEMAGELGPRRGRRRVWNQAHGNILGVGAFVMPGERFRIFAYSDGSVRPEVLTWPDPSTVPPLGGDTVRISGLTVTQTGAGTTNGTSKALETALDLAAFTHVGLDFATYSDAFSTVESGGFSQGNVTLQARIDGTWTDVWRWTFGAAGMNEVQLLALPATGSLTDVRLQATSSVSGDLQGDLTCRLRFSRQADAAEIGVS